MQTNTVHKRIEFLIGVAPGVDLKKDILPQMKFRLQIAQ